jgi:hypothetical protein
MLVFRAKNFQSRQQVLKLKDHLLSGIRYFVWDIFTQVCIDLNAHKTEYFFKPFEKNGRHNIKQVIKPLNLRQHSEIWKQT